MMKDVFRLRHIQIRRMEITFGIICALVGFLLVNQLRVQRSLSQQLPALTEQNLGQIIRELSVETESLQREVADLRIKLYKYEREEADKKTILNEAAQKLENLRIVTGLVEVEGQGVRIQLDDKKGLLGSYDMLDLIQELRAAGAETISMSGQRVTAGTAFKRREGSLWIDGNAIDPPYEVKAIGDPETLYQGITLAGGVRDVLSSLEGVSLTIIMANDLSIPAIVKEVKPLHAIPVEKE
jgi:uncharacterized protein YlxW (UPF0749 family)